MARRLSRLSWLLACAAVVAAVWGLSQWLTLTPDETQRLRDDAFYEFSWAANVALGRGPTVSDGTTTSGVQWLWSLLLVPWAWLFGPGALPLFAPWLGLLLHVVTAGLWFRSQRDRLLGFCLAMCWLGHPLLLREAQNGQETALACCLATALVVARRSRESRFLVLSVLAVLARSDLLALVVTLSWLRHRTRPLHALPVPLVAYAVPLLGNLLYGGGWLPDSALPMAWLWHENHAATDPTLAGYLRELWWFARPVFLGGPFATASVFGFGLVAFALIRPWWPRSLRVVPALVVGAAAAIGVKDLATPGWAALLLLLLPAAGRRRLPLPTLAIFVGLLAIVVLHWPLRWYPRDYYLAPLVVAAFATMARLARWRLLLLAFIVVQVQDSWRVTPEPLAGQREMAMAGRYLSQFLPTSERVGCFNSGLVTFYADVLAEPGERRGIVNLDGVVDARSFAALRAGRLSNWLDEQGVRFVLDISTQFERDPSVPHASGRHFGPDFDAARDLVEIARFDVPFVHGALPRGDSVRLYWRRGRGEMPARPIAPGEWRTLPRSPWHAGRSYLLWGARAGEAWVAIDEHGGRETIVAVDVDTAVLFEFEFERYPGCNFEIEPR